MLNQESITNNSLERQLYASKSRGRSLDSYLLYMSGKCYSLNNTDVAQDI